MKIRYKKIVALAVGLVGCAMLAQQAQAVPWTLGFSSTSDSIHFDGAGGFSFVPGGAPSSVNSSFKINSEQGGASPLTDQSFATISGAFSLGAGGTGTLRIESAFDSSVLTASVHFGAPTINAVGTTGTLNELDLVNIDTIVYAGADPSLNDLFTAKSAVMILTWNFPDTGHTLANLSSVAQKTTFSGNITLPVVTVPDGGLTVALLGFALLSVEGLRRKLNN